ncbi:MAG: chloride channel protein [Deltaproteobacteria bacterium]|nr:chloride channel protein [Deltaproteobacteria bacterium]
MLLHTTLVGVAAGLIGAFFFAAVEYLQYLFLESLAGYSVLRANGETLWTDLTPATDAFRPWILVLLPALGGLACGLLTRLAPETRGGGGNATIDSFHRHDGVIPARVIWIRMLASFCTLGTGGAGGREGPTMQIGGALGSLVARLLRVSARERRILLLAGVAAGISAVFRTPLGAALLAVEFLYRDGFEADALVPSILASVIAYSVVISIYGEATLFTHALRFPFIPGHLPLYGLLALLVAGLAATFAASLRLSHRLFVAFPVAAWMRPAIGGLVLGIFCTPVILYVGQLSNTHGQGLGVLGSGYGAVQAAISGASWLPDGASGILLLTMLSLAKLVAASITIGSEGSAGDFAPSLAIGGLFGGAFGRAAEMLLQDPTIDPGAFALVGMGVFYGGIAHVPLSALVLVCELAGNYDLLVPLMLAQGIAFVALRNRTIYPAQVPTLRESPVHRDAFLLDALKSIRVADLMTQGRAFVRFSPETPARIMLERISEATWQDVFPVLDASDRLAGLVTSDGLRVLANEGSDLPWAIAADLMQAPVSVRSTDDLRLATERIVNHGLREIPVVDERGAIVGFLDEADVATIYLKAASRAPVRVEPKPL